MAVSSKKLDNFVHVVVTRMLDSMKAKRLLFTCRSLVSRIKHTKYTCTVMRSCVSLLHLIGAYSEGHADNVAILFDIGYEVAHVTCIIHVIPHPLMVNLH